MVMTFKATPRAVLRGIKDESTRALPPENTNLPQHLPIWFLLTEKSDVVQIVGPNAAKQIYGDKTFEPTSPFFNHQTVGAVTSFKRGNQAMVIPIKMPTAKKASVRIFAELVAATVKGKHVTRVIFHSVPLFQNMTEEEKQKLPANDIRRLVFDMEEHNAQMIPVFRQGNVQAELSTDKLGALVDEGGKEYYTPSALYPLFELSVESVGSYGNNFAFTFDAPNSSDPNPTDSNILYGDKNFVYRLSLYRKNSATSNPTLIYNNYSETANDFVLKTDFVNKLTNVPMSLGNVITENYQSVDNPNGPDIEAPFPNVSIYQEEIENVLNQLAVTYEVEAVAEDGSTKTFEIEGILMKEDLDDGSYRNRTPREIEDSLYMINLFTGTDVDGKPYANADFSNSRKFGGIRFGKDALIWAAGGTDGFPINDKTKVVDKLALLDEFDKAVKDWCENFTDLNPIFDSAKYPFSAIWDTGFSIGTKKALMKPTGQHKRIWTTLGTHAVADYADPVAMTGWGPRQALTGAEEVAVGMMLRAAALLIPESTEFGTPTVRVAICGRSGILANSEYRERLPLTIELIHKVSGYFGADNGVLNTAYAFDAYPNNRVELFRDVNITYQSSNVYNKSWDAGIMWVQHDDVKTTFFPAFRTVYPDDTSVLTSYITMICAAYIERVCEIVWRKIVGNGKLTAQEFLERSDYLISQELNGKFDNRFRIVPRTYYTSTDEILGYRWSTDIEFYANNMKTVGLYTIVARRMSDYEG